MGKNQNGSICRKLYITGTKEYGNFNNNTVSNGEMRNVANGTK